MPATSNPPTAAVSTDVWDRLRGSFAMADCDADPAVLAQARYDTRYPDHFENQLQAVLPRLVYVQQIASHYDVAGEFVLLPWVESHFQPVPAHRNRPAGMWQLTRATAEAMGLHIDRRYDGRMDVPGATQAVMKLLQRYHDQFHDWRVTDYAYNAGEYAVQNIVRKHGMPAEFPVIPTWPVRKVTREHLTKLLAIACVVRDPGRFNVSLPTLPADEHLVQMDVPYSMPMAQAARHADMSADAMKHLNAAFRTDMIDVGSSAHLILPAGHARQFQRTMLALQHHAGEPPASDDALADATVTAQKTHTVKSGESLWQIAHENSVKVDQLQRWNQLHGHTLKPGQVLQLQSAN